MTCRVVSWDLFPTTTKMVEIYVTSDEPGGGQPSADDRLKLDQAITLREVDLGAETNKQVDILVNCEQKSSGNCVTQFCCSGLCRVISFSLYCFLSFLCCRREENKNDEGPEETAFLPTNPSPDVVTDVEPPGPPMSDWENGEANKDVDLSQTPDVDDLSLSQLSPAEPVVGDDLHTDPACLSQKNHIILLEASQPQTSPSDTHLSVHLKKDGRGAPSKVEHHLNRPPDLSSVSTPFLGNTVATTGSEEGQLTNLNQRMDICHGNYKRRYDGRQMPLFPDSGRFTKQEDVFTGRRPKTKHVMKQLENNQDKTTSPVSFTNTEKGKVPWTRNTMC